MNIKKCHFRRKSRATLAWTLLLFFGGHLLLGWHLHRRHANLFDPEYTVRLRDLRQRMAEAPGRPLALLLGSSRMAFGLQPESATQQAALGVRTPVLFNFALLGAGPVRERLVLHRLLESGIRPQWVFIEVWPPFFPQTGFYSEEHVIFEHDVYRPDLSVIGRLFHRRHDAFNQLVAETITPALHYRAQLLDRGAPFLLSTSTLLQVSMSDLAWKKMDGSGWLPAPFERPSPASFPAALQHAQNMTKPVLDHFQIDEVSDKALHDMLDDCRAYGIRTVLLFMPEHSTLRSWYPQQMRDKWTEYLRRLNAEYHVPTIDARTWCGDEQFTDYCHLRPEGARSFSELFGREVYRPLLEDHDLNQKTLLAGSW